ncbi:hypothetical protein FIU94_08920 [Sulfitobacter sp. THAF37]|uniref:DUF2268 domain-containing putative Zn-dependent protease n=1 Tax=Sulfitobacter sp. THAF37 TaxID=2587855 RepID=UPI001268402D|nr:DUF2268 domain-containing putative Zn-dependent protease [Sulfitobacter sp. THAF37]QFT58946.1 hypothetical protein FIU94_08920 [Sulfitobacter sp. THAF37]
MTWAIHIANASGHLNGLVSPIRKAIERAQSQAEAVSARVDLDVIVQVWPGRVIPHLGHVGYAPTGDMIQLTFDPSNPNCAHNLGEALERTVVHEFHHALRWRGPGYGSTLGEALVSEGLAGHFAQQLYGGPPEMWETSLDGQDLSEAARDAAAAWYDDAYDHAGWFFGSDPAWRGYGLGFALIRRHLSIHPEETAATLVHADAERFRGDLEVVAD